MPLNFINKNILKTQFHLCLLCVQSTPSGKQSFPVPLSSSLPQSDGLISSRPVACGLRVPSSRKRGPRSKMALLMPPKKFLMGRKKGMKGRITGRKKSRTARKNCACATGGFAQSCEKRECNILVKLSFFPLKTFVYYNRNQREFNNLKAVQTPHETRKT